MVGLFFPGQGAQAVGMGRDLFEKSPAAHKLFLKADEVLARPLSKLIFEGPEEELTQTVNAQPAIYVTSLAVLAALQEAVPNFKPVSACGLSLGELSALAALGVFSFEDGLRIVSERGKYMEEAARNTKGGMVSLVGLDLAQATQIAKDAGIEVANINAPDQIVLSGKTEGVEQAAKLAEAMGAKRALVLKVSGAFHSSLMQEAGVKLAKLLEPIRFSAPQGLFLSNVTGQFESDPGKIKANLASQVTGSVQWVKTLESLAGKGLMRFVELAPGRVLKGLVRRFSKDMAVESLETASDLAKVSEMLVNPAKEAVHAS